MMSMLAANAVEARRGRTHALGHSTFATVIAFVALSAAPALAQLGNGWTSTSFTKKIHLDDDSGLQTFNWTSHKSVCSPTCADYSYDTATDTETFRLLDGRTNRSEIRLQNEYSN